MLSAGSREVSTPAGTPKGSTPKGSDAGTPKGSSPKGGLLTSHSKDSQGTHSGGLSASPGRSQRSHSFSPAASSTFNQSDSASRSKLATQASGSGALRRGQSADKRTARFAPTGTGGASQLSGLDEDAPFPSEGDIHFWSSGSPGQQVIDEGAAGSSSGSSSSSVSSDEDDAFSLIDDAEAAVELSEESSEGLDTLTTVSNETDRSEGGWSDQPAAERQIAMVLAPQPWVGLTRPALQCAAACLLPLVLAGVLMCGLCKCLGVFLQCFFDVLYVLVRFALLALRTLLLPLYMLYKAVAPTWLQHRVSDTYDDRMGKRLRQLNMSYKEASELIADFPAISEACYAAAFETVVNPLKARCWAFLFWLAGQRAKEWVLEPWHDREINRAAKRRRRQLERAQMADPVMREQIKRHAPKRARAQARRRLEQQRRAQRRRRAEAFALRLMLPVNDESLRDGAVSMEVDFMQNHVRTSRVMRVQRRYAVAIGVVWIVVGVYILTVTLYGNEGDSCDLCFDRPDLDIRLCRHGTGRSCAFELHLQEMAIAITTICVGSLLLVYAIFLYRPAQKTSKAKPGKQETGKRRRRVLVKDEDPELATLKCIQEELKRPTCGRRLKDCYQNSPCFMCVVCSFRTMDCFSQALLRCEHRHRMADCSLAVQETLATTGSYLQALGRLMCCRDEEPDEPEETEVLRRAFTQIHTSVTTSSYHSVKSLVKGKCKCLCCRRRKGADMDVVDIGSASPRVAGDGPRMLVEVLDQFGLMQEVESARRSSIHTRGSRGSSDRSRRMSVTKEDEEPTDYRAAYLEAADKLEELMVQKTSTEAERRMSELQAQYAAVVQADGGPPEAAADTTGAADEGSSAGMEELEAGRADDQSSISEDISEHSERDNAR